MKKAFLLLLVVCGGAFAQNNTIARWRGMEGVITVPGMDNPICPIRAGAGPWTAQSGSARINLNTGEGSFDVEGLFMNGGFASGTTGAVTSVVGTLVCNPGSTTGPAEAVIDTPAVNLSAEGNAELSFQIDVPVGCSTPLFLIRVPSGRWIATGTKSAIVPKSRF